MGIGAKGRRPSDAWWLGQRPLTAAELFADGVVHAVGLLIAGSLGSVLLYFGATHTARGELPALVIYVGTLFSVLTASLAFNLWPISPIKRFLARLDQAAIFLFIAGTYTPFLAVIAGTTAGNLMTVLVWGAALIGIALKLLIPERFGRLAIPLYLGIGWSGVLVFQNLALRLPPSTLWLLLAGGIVYSLGIIFHLWERLKFQNVVWHIFVVVGASLHLWAILDFAVLARL